MAVAVAAPRLQVLLFRYESSDARSKISRAYTAGDRVAGTKAMPLRMIMPKQRPLYRRIDVY